MIIPFSLYMGKKPYSKFLYEVSYFQLCSSLVSLAWSGWPGEPRLCPPSYHFLQIDEHQSNMPKVIVRANRYMKTAQPSSTPCMSELGSGNVCHQTKGTHQSVMLLSPLFMGLNSKVNFHLYHLETK